MKNKHINPARNKHLGETFEKYKKRRKQMNKLLKKKLRGVFVYQHPEPVKVDNTLVFPAGIPYRRGK